MLPASHATISVPSKDLGASTIPVLTGALGGLPVAHNVRLGVMSMSPRPRRRLAQRMANFETTAPCIIAILLVDWRSTAGLR
jgi:hypothetical protein